MEPSMAAHITDPNFACSVSHAAPVRFKGELKYSATLDCAQFCAHPLHVLACLSKGKRAVSSWKHKEIQMWASRAKLLIIGSRGTLNQ